MKKTKQLVLCSCVALFLLGFGVIIAFQFNAVQTKAGTYVATILSKKLKYNIQVKALSIKWFESVQLNDISIEDSHQDTLAQVSSIYLNYSFSDLFNSRLLHLEEVNIEGLAMNLLKKNGGKVNLEAFIHEVILALEDSTVDNAGAAHYGVHIEKLRIQELYINYTKITDSFPNNQLLSFDVPHFGLSDFSIKKDTITSRIEDLKVTERVSGFLLEHLHGDLFMSNTELRFDDFALRTPNSYLDKKFTLYYEDFSDLSSFKTKVNFDFSLDSTTISKHDMGIILGNKTVGLDIGINGNIKGTFSNFDLIDGKLKIGNNSELKGKMSCFGLPDLDQTFIIADFHESYIEPTDIAPLFGGLYDNLQHFGVFNFNGNFTGFIKDFVAYGDFQTRFGNFTTDINLKIPTNAQESEYSGEITMKEVDLGGFLRVPWLQKFNLNGFIKGKGITSETANLFLNGLAYNSCILGHCYDTIRADGRFSANFFEGTLSIQDEQCVADLKTQIDFKEQPRVLSLAMKVDSVHLDKINLVKEPFFARGNINVDIKNFDVNQFEGEVKADSTFFKLRDNTLSVDSIMLSASNGAGGRHIKITLPDFEGMIEGNFKLEDIIKDFTTLYHEYLDKLNFQHLNRSKEESGQQYEFNFSLLASNLNQYLGFFNLPLKVANDLKLETEFRKGKTTNLSMVAACKEISWQDNHFFNVTIEAHSAKTVGKTDILTSFLVLSDTQKIKKIPATENFTLEGVWFDDNINFFTEIHQYATKSIIQLNVESFLYEDSITMSVVSSDVELFDELWSFNPSNKITIDKEGMRFKNLEIYDSHEFVLIDGTLSSTKGDFVNITTQDVSLNKLSLFTDLEILGFLNGDFNLKRPAGSEFYQFEGDIQIKDLGASGVVIGDINGKSRWIAQEESIEIKVNVDRKGTKSILLSGKYFPTKKEEQLDFNLVFNNAQLRQIEPFVVNFLTDIKGTANGNFSITGNLKTPSVKGKCNLNDGSVHLNYLNTDYHYSGQFLLNDQKIALSKFEIIDNQAGKATLNGDIEHHLLKNFKLDLFAEAQNFTFLNTTSQDNDIYYGTAIGTGDIRITGAVEDLFIKTNLKTEKGTKMFIPLNGSDNVELEDYITFVDFSKEQKEEQKDIDLSGVTFDFDIEVTPEAYSEIIFDIKKGDIIRGRSNGNLNLRMDREGEFFLFGTLEIDQGAYNFTTSIINKEFEILQGSTIKWSGDPYQANLNLEAKYHQRASFEGLKNKEEQDVNQLSSKTDLDVWLYLTGLLTEPIIQFDITPSDNLSNGDGVNALIDQIRNDEQELKRQVISLLFLKRFSPRESFFLGNGGDIGTNLSEYLSGQLSYLISQIDENLEIDIDLASLDNNAFNTFQLRFSYTLLDGRLRLSSGSNVYDNTQQVDFFNDIVGDWSVEYLLTAEGKLRLKVFRNSERRFASTNQYQYQEAGVSLKWVYAFNTIREEAQKRKRHDAFLNKREIKNN